MALPQPNNVTQFSTPRLRPMKPFVQTPLDVMKNHALSPWARLLFGLLHNYNSAERGCFPRRELLASDLGVSIPTIDRALKELCDHRLITKKRQGRGHANLYFFPDESSPVISHVDESSPVSTPESSPVTSLESSPVMTPIRTRTKELEPKKDICRAKQIPDDFTVTGEMRDKAIEYGVHPSQIEFETEKFRDYYISKGETRKDWVASWRTWMRNSLTFSKSGMSRQSATQSERVLTQHERQAEESAQRLKDWGDKPLPEYDWSKDPVWGDKS